MFQTVSAGHRCHLKDFS